MPAACKFGKGRLSPTSCIVGPVSPERMPDLANPDSGDALDDLPVESPDGVDLTLIRWTLSLTPLERLELLQDWVDGLTELRRGRVDQH